MQYKKDLALARLDNARECLETARVNVANNLYKGAANRSYYCIFNLMRSVLAFDEFDTSKHSGVISYFREHYIKTGKFNKRISYIITDLFKTRTAGDYHDFFVLSLEKVEKQIEDAAYFIEQVEQFLQQQT
jgi:uncharacterized protein (UPF0332 family)